MKNVFIIALFLAVFCSCSQDKTNTLDNNSYSVVNKDNMQEVYQFIKECGCYYIATMEGDQPRVRPFGTINVFDGKLYIQTGHKKRIAKQILANPKVEICAYNGSKWMRVEAKLVEDTRVEAKKSMLDAYPNLRSMYDENDENTAVYFLTEATAFVNTFSDPMKTLKIN